MKKLLLLLFIPLLFISCVEEDGEIIDDNPTVDTVSFSQDIMPIINTNCLECHFAIDEWPDGDYDMTSHDAVMTTGLHYPNVIPFFPDSSYLIHVISEDDSTGHDGSPYDEETVVEPLRQWIEQGALNN